MESKVQELADKLYQEGVQKGEKKAEEIAAAARAQADKQLAAARAQAERVLADARTQAEELKRNMEADIRLAGQQALSVVRQRVLDVVTAAATDAPVKAAFTSPATVAELVKLVVGKWDMTSPEAPSLEVLLPESQRKELEKALAADIAGFLARGVKVAFSPSVKAGLQIGRAGGGFKVSLTDQDFTEFIREFLRPRTRAFLFGER